MKKLITYLLVLAIGLPCWAEDKVSSSTTDTDLAPRTAKNFFSDGAYLLSSPLRINRDNVIWPLAAVAAIGTAAAFDSQIREHLFNWKDTDPSEDMRLFGDHMQLAGPVIGTGFLLEGFAMDNDKSKETGYLAYESFVYAGIIAAGFKYVVGRERPSKTDDPFKFKPFSGDSSFPSGHTTEVFTAATVFTEQYPHWYVAVPAYGLAAATGFSRMYANKHWFSDVVAGGILGTSVAHFLRARHRRSHQYAWDLQTHGTDLQLVHRF